MKNKYGFFRYLDYALGAKEAAFIDSSEELQEGSTLDQLRSGVQPVEIASFEQDNYVTSEKLLMFNGQVPIGFVTKQISDSSGYFSKPIELQVSFNGYFSMTGLTLNARNVIASAKIEAYRDDEKVAEGIASGKSTTNFLPLSMELVNFVKVTIYQIREPFHFLGIYSIDFGSSRDFDESMNESVRITQNFSVLGDSLEFDTLDLSIITPESGEGYLFQRKQPINYILNGSAVQTFYVDSGDEGENNVASVRAYDEIANLKDDFLGGIYENCSVGLLINEIIENRFPYSIELDEDVLLSGYIPICSRGKALQMVLLASNMRCYKQGGIVFKPLQSHVSDVVIDQGNIIGNPQKERKQPVRSVTVTTRNYSKNSERTELHHWYLSKTSRTRITFSNPFHDLKAFEVVGEDEHGNDIVSETESENVLFIETGANYCIVDNSSNNKIVITGAGYSKGTEEFKKENPIIGADKIYYDFNIDLTVHSDGQSVCDLLYDLYSRRNSIKLKTLQPVIPGVLYNILGDVYHIKKVKNTLEGIYEVEAV